MEKQELINKTTSTLSPFETGNIVHFMQNLTMKSAMENPILIAFLLVVAFYAIIKRSKFVLAVLFTAIAVMLLVRYTIPTEPDTSLSISTTLPFALGGLVIGGVLIYFFLIKTD